MKIIVFTIWRNRADLAPFFLRHYETFTDEIAVFDDDSTDGSREMLAAHPKVVLRDWPHPGSGIDEDLFLRFAYDWSAKAHPVYQWAIWADPDEFVYHPNIRRVLAEGMIVDDGHVGAIKADGYNMLHDGLPVDDGRQIYEVAPMGVRAPVYSKPVIYNPDPSLELRWIRGKHDVEHLAPSVTVWKDSGIKLLHFRYLGEEYTRRRNAENYARCGLANGDKGPAWSCAPDYRGEGSPEWVNDAMKLAFKVV